MNARAELATRTIFGELWTIVEALLLALLFLLLVVFALSIQNPEVIGFETFAVLSNTNGYYYSGGFLLGQIAFLSVALYRRKKQKTEIAEWKSLGRDFAPGKKAILGFGAGLGLVLLVTLFGYALQLIGAQENLFETGREWARSFGIFEKLSVLFALGIIAPICEELFFREIVFGKILRAGFPVAGLIFSSLAYSVVHFDFFFIPVLFIYGAAFAVLYQTTRSLAAPITAHLTVNMIFTSVTLFSGNLSI